MIGGGGFFFFNASFEKNILFIEEEMAGWHHRLNGRESG